MCHEDTENVVCVKTRTLRASRVFRNLKFWGNERESGPEVLHSSDIPRLQWRTEVGGFEGVQTPPPPKFRRSSSIVQNSTRLWKLLKIATFRTPTPQVVRKKGSKILKLPPVRNCFTLTMANKLGFIINSLKVPQIKQLLLYEMIFLVPNYSCLQNPQTRGLPLPDPRSLCPLSSTEFVEPPPSPPRTEFLGTPLPSLS